MIKKFLDKLMGKPAKTANAAAKAAEAAGGTSSLGKRVEVGKAEHGIDVTLVDDRAVKVVQTLTDGGFESYIVGGAVRDLLLGLRPKDFDVATNATPEQVKALFRRAFIIGRRFRIVHVVFGRGRQDRGLSEVIEVSTFRAVMDAAAAEQVVGNEKTLRNEDRGAGSGSGRNAPATGHVVDADGRVLRDNVWGPQIEDAARRDFTVNAMYYNPQTEIVVDYHGGLKDAKKKLLRMIGDPETRYREDPVRIIRAVRFAAKLGFEVEPKTRAPIRTMAALLDNVPPSRLFDEMIKLLQTGHSLASLAELRKQGLQHGVFPVLDVLMNDVKPHDGREKFVNLALADTDRRVGEGKPVAPSFMLACMLWHDVLDGWRQLKARGEAPIPALQQAVDAVFDARIGDISGRGKLAADMRDIWLMQPRLERRSGNGPFTLIEQPRFRAGFDFLRLRAEVGEIDAELGTWWEAFSLGSDAERERLMDAVKQADTKRRANAPVKARSSRDDEAESDASEEGPNEDNASEGSAVDPVRKRRRRRRKPSEGRAASAPADAAGGTTE
jgi:poly(A) polymerase